MTYENATPQEVQGWIRTEPADAMDPKALADIKSKLAQNDPKSGAIQFTSPNPMAKHT